MRKLTFFLLWMTMELSTGADEYCKNYSIEDCADDLVKSFCPFCDSITPTEPTEVNVKNPQANLKSCGTRDTEGLCVPFYHCDEDRTIKTAGEGILQERFSDVCAATESCCSLSKNLTICSENGKEGLCVQYNLCSSYDDKNTFGVGIIAERFTDACEPSETCCEEKGIKKAEKVERNKTCYIDGVKGECVINCNNEITARPNYNISNYENNCHFLETCCTKTEKSNIIPVGERMQNAKPKLCGERNKNGALFSISSENSEAQFGEFPWMLFLYAQEKPTDTSLYICGGSLIHPKVAITAAHCIKKVPNKSKLYVRAGDWDTATEKEPLPHKNVKVEKIIIHDKYYKGGLHNDLAILILESSIEENDHIGVICLPPPIEVQPRSDCVSTGWGKKATEKGGSFQNILKKIDLPVVSHSSCQLALRKTRLGVFFKLHESFMCAGGEQGKDTCKGDGGSPLICPTPNDPTRYMQVGIVAWGIGCGEENIPGVYANIPFMRSWILSQLKLNNIDMSKYEN